MNKLVFICVLICVAVFCAQASGKGKSGGGGAKGAGTMNVQVREAIVRATPNYMGAAAGTVAYGTEVNVAGEEGNWYRIDKPSGWLPKSALTKHKVAVDPDKKFAGKGTSHDEVALAGKGFNPQVEAQYKKGNADLAAAYNIVDKIEKFDASEAELKSFQAAGKLKPR